MIYTLKSPTWTDLKPQTAHQARQVTTGHTRVISPENDRGGVQPHRECDGGDVPQVVSLILGYTVRSEARCRSTSLPQAGYVSCTCAVETKEARWETQDGIKEEKKLVFHWSTIPLKPAKIWNLCAMGMCKLSIHTQLTLK